jgi:nitrate/TMAO reductase-like tetraheme cytochrome c subunit
MSTSASSRLRWLGIAIAAGFVAFPIGWVVTDRLEQDNEFCTSCHLDSATPLHIDLRRAFDRSPGGNLASVHGHAEVPDRGGGFRCIDCHGGASWTGRARVKVLAAKDAFWYAVGRFDEPTGMQWPLWEEDCLKCHTSFDPATSEEWETPRFHELPIHNVELGVDCVACHRAHDTGGNPDAFFLGADWVRPQCGRCHSRDAF